MKQSEPRLYAVICGVLAVFALAAPAALAGNTPINDLGSGLYLGQFQGGLYPDGLNQPPAAHAVAGLDRMGQVQPLDTLGNPSTDGKYVLLSIGMSNTTQEFSVFRNQANADPRVNHDSLAIIDGAKGGQATSAWTSPFSANYNRIRDEVLAPQGLGEQQVQAVWVKTANPSPRTSLPASGSDAYTLVRQMGDVTRALETRYPNLQLVFFSSRIYAGYATTQLNPEPYAYESGFAVKWLVEAQIDQMATGQVDPRAGDLNYDTGGPWIGWGPYLWADGLNPRSDGLIWRQSDFGPDGTHPSTSGREKVTDLLMDFMLTSPLARPWFAAPIVGDMDGSFSLTEPNGNDVNPFVLALVDRPAYEAAYPGIDADVVGDIDGNGSLDGNAIKPFVDLLTAGGSAIPEPASALVLIVGLAGVILRRRRS